jgi:hypothetical protein
MEELEDMFGRLQHVEREKTWERTRIWTTGNDGKIPESLAGMVSGAPLTPHIDHEPLKLGKSRKCFRRSFGKGSRPRGETATSNVLLFFDIIR